jgi:hypothetical protein
MIDNGHRYLDIKGLEMFFGMISMGILMGLYQTEGQHLSGIFYKLFKAILGDY